MLMERNTGRILDRGFGSQFGFSSNRKTENEAHTKAYYNSNNNKWIYLQDFICLFVQVCHLVQLRLLFDIACNYDMAFFIQKATSYLFK